MRANTSIITIVSGIVLAMAATAFWASRTKPIPVSIKLGDCTNATLRFSFVAPPGDSYNFAIGVGGTKDIAELKQPDYRGKLQISDGHKALFDLDFESLQSRTAFWIRREDGIAGYTFTLPRREGQQTLDNVLMPKRNYEVVVTFSSPPPAESSMWLEWHQRGVDSVQ